MYCQSCGAEVRSGQKFCANCGAEVGSSVASPTPSPAPEPDAQPAPAPTATEPASESAAPPKKRPIASIAAVAVLAIGVVVALVSFVVMPLMQPKGIWVVTKSTTQSEVHPEDDDAYTYSYLDEWELDANGNPTSYTNTYTGSEGQTSTVSYSYAYDDEGRCQERTYSATELTENSILAWDVDSEGKATKMSCVSDVDGEMTCAYAYNKQGFIEEQTFTLAEGTKQTNTFDEKGLLVKTVVTGDDVKATSEYTYEYDLQQRPISVKAIRTNDTTGEVELDLTGAITYDEHGNVAKEVNDATYLETDGTHTQVREELTYECAYVENPSPWLVQMTHLYTINKPTTF